MKPYLLSCLLLFTIIQLSAQGIKGKLIDATTGVPIGYANLSLVDQSDPKRINYTSTDSAGNFSFAKLTVGSHTLSAVMMGYRKLAMEIIIKQGGPDIDLGNIKLTEDPAQLNTVTITGGTPTYSTRNGQLKVAVASNAFFKTASNLTEVLRRLPGLQVNPDGTMLLASRAVPTIFIDGKPIEMNPEEIQAYLSGLSPETVESIELINQPSSRYDGQYQGIIDIKLKRNISPGLKGLYNLRYQQNQRAIVDNSLSLGYKTAKFIYSLSGGATTGSTYYKYRALQFLQNTNALTTDTRTITANQNYNIQARAFHEPKKGKMLEAYFRTFQIDRNAETDNELATLDNSQKTIIAMNMGDNSARPKQHNYAGGINYDLSNENSELHILSSIAQIDNRQNENIRNWQIGSAQIPSHWKTSSRNNILIRSAQADYSIMLGSSKLETGIKYALTTTANDLRYDTLSNGNFHPDPLRSNQFSYREQISAGYLSYGNNLGKFSYALSLRAEHTRTLAGSITNNSRTRRYYLKWLPSASLSYELGASQQLSLSYSRRLTRPSFNALNPFRFYYSARHYWIGNPLLQPSTTNLFSLTYSRLTLNISLSAGRENDPMVRYPEYDPVTNVLIFKGDNLPYRDFVNLRASMPLSITPWWKTNNNITLYYNKELRPYFGNTFQIPVYNYTFTGSQLFSVKNLTIDLSYSLESKSGNSLYVFAPVRTIDIGLQRQWLKGKISTKLSAQDIFGGGRRRVIFREKTIMDNDFYHDNATRRLVVALSYNFGSSQHSQKETKRSEEESRAER